MCFYRKRKEEGQPISEIILDPIAELMEATDMSRAEVVKNLKARGLEFVREVLWDELFSDAENEAMVRDSYQRAMKALEDEANEPARETGRAG
ncbi:hypothetical protein QYE77_08960 [Thermanaerothrix sp. 4228-RoL]|uniref:Ribbon-helix-helix protein CopG domain-containing protein n=1 Tax=Thermanaerothrix solaris TaxID=3058434 RepID=A0ABU3NNH0_9CHLR|nr:hypothetical protein [Thermanaerothrix sp. 4228-RoL]MDT8898395.1 hypothetical protein [Thermanaerothrix sp. 4228-RoL]